jgi:folate-binding protein YgfZ
MTTIDDRDAVRAEYAALRSTAAAHPLRRDVVSAHGPDAAEYLQGQCSQDVLALSPGASADSLLLSPQGKIEAYLRITRTGDDEFVLDTDEGFGEAVLARLQRFRLRTTVEFESLPWVCVAVRGPGAAGAVTGRPALVVPVEWPGLAGVDLLGPAPDGGLGEWVGDVVRCGDDAWEAARIEAGVPVNGREVVEGSIAAEVGLVDRSVSFTKGCFTGQELVARLDARGSNVARRLCGVVVADGAAAAGTGSAVAPRSAAVPVGATVTTTDDTHVVGSLTSTAWSPGRSATVALATLHRRVTPPAVVVVTWEDADGAHSVAADALPLPLGI